MRAGQIMKALESGKRLPRSAYIRAGIHKGVDALAVAAAALKNGDDVAANTAATKVMELNRGLVRSDWFIRNVARELALDVFEKPGLNPWIILQRVFHERAHGSAEAALNLAETGLSGGKGHPDTLYRLFEEGAEALMKGASLADPNRRDVLERYVERHRYHSPEAALLYKACLSHYDGDYAEAEALYRGFAEADLTLSHFSGGARSYRAVLPEQEIDAPEPNFQRLSPTPKIIVFTCDPGYFLQWQGPILNSLTRAPAELGVHFHIVGKLPPEKIDAILAADPRIGLSCERDPGLGAPYYASARFISGGALLAAYDRPLLFSDIDCIFRPHVSDLFAFLADRPAAMLIKRDDCHFPWRSITANLFYLPPTAAAQSFLSVARSYLMGVFAAESGNPVSLWWCDQNALAYAARVSGLGVQAHSLFKLDGLGHPLPFVFAPQATEKKAAFIAEHGGRVA